MQDLISKTFGGLSLQYYFRQLFFGALFLALIIWMTIESRNSVHIGMIAFSVVNTLLYPYSRFVYESIVNFIIGNNVFFGRAIFMLLVKSITMLMCWFFAMFVAPVGLLYLYIYHRRAQN